MQVISVCHYEEKFMMLLNKKILDCFGTQMVPVVPESCTPEAKNRERRTAAEDCNGTMGKTVDRYISLYSAYSSV